VRTFLRSCVIAGIDAMKSSTSKPTPQVPNKPAHEIRLGSVRATIWTNETEKGLMYNTTFERSYRDGNDWKSSTSFGQGDLLNLAFVAEQAMRWIIEQRAPSGLSPQG
jgi:hypothetical protein